MVGMMMRLVAMIMTSFVMNPDDHDDGDPRVVMSGYEIMMSTVIITISTTIGIIIIIIIIAGVTVLRAC